jgi:hypothetical protein
MMPLQNLLVAYPPKSATSADLAEALACLVDLRLVEFIDIQGRLVIELCQPRVPGVLKAPRASAVVPEALKEALSRQLRAREAQRHTRQVAPGMKQLPGLPLQERAL